MKCSLFSYEPDTYRKSKVMSNILEAQEKQLDRAEKQMTGLESDLLASTTSHPELWENEYGIMANDTVEKRRKTILAKMRGTQTITKEKAENIVKAFTEGDVAVVEDADDSRIYVHITSEGVYTEPGDYEDTLYEVIPAHLEIVTRQTIVHNQRPEAHYGSVIDTGETVDIL